MQILEVSVDLKASERLYEPGPGTSLFFFSKELTLAFYEPNDPFGNDLHFESNIVFASY